MNAEYIDNNGKLIIADKMLPCPFCGTGPSLLFIGNNFTKYRRVTIKCTGCKVERTTETIRNDAEWCAKMCIHHWNNREAYAKQRGEVPTDVEIEKAMMDYHAKIVDSGKNPFFINGFTSAVEYMRQFKSTEQQKRIEVLTAFAKDVCDDWAKQALLDLGWDEEDFHDVEQLLKDH